ncbi:MAG: carbon-nitrogen hydrolase family protein [Polaromonas sp.]|nr:MAG: carbon-nitrogen hydrolase family protein [Polaromonas sp.]
MKVAALQMVSGTDLQRNLDIAAQLLAEAAAGGAELAVLPEYFCVMGLKDTDKLALQERFGAGPVQDFLAQSAKRLGLWIVGGTLPVAAPQSAASGIRRIYNTCLVFNPSGQCVARYDKMHLFRFDNGTESYDESRVLLPGTLPVTFELPSSDGCTWRIGLSICYDLRFPELYRALSADVLLVPSAFTFTTGQAHWDVLLRARAIENFAFVIAAAQGGLHENGRRTWGHSMAVAPWGNVLAQHPEGPAVVMAELHQQVLVDARARLPALSHRVLQ